MVAVLLSVSPAVVAELDDVVLVAVPLGVHYETEKGLFLLLPVDHHPPPEEPVTTVLAWTPQCRESIREKNTPRNKNHRAWQHTAHKPHLFDWARSKHSTLVGFLLILSNIDV